MKIAFVSQPEYFRFTYEDDLQSEADIIEFRLQIGLAPEHYAPLIEYQADYNFFFRGEFVPDSVLTKLSGQKIALSSEPFPRVVHGRLEYTRDSILRYLHFRSIRNKPFDYVFHYDAASLPFFERDALHVSGAFPFPVATSTYRHVPNDPRWDLFFIGRSTLHRERHFGYLKHRYNFLHICHGIWGPDLVEYMSRAQICLNVHAEPEISWEPRVQMMLSCGCFVISEKITPNEVLRPGIDFVEISGAQQLHEAVAHYLNSNEERKSIAMNGANRVREALDSRSNFLRLIEGINNRSYRRFGSDKGSTFVDVLQGAYNAWIQMKSYLP